MSLLARIIAAWVLAGCLLCSCSSKLPGYLAPASSSPAVPSPSPLVSTMTRDGELGALSARGVVDALSKTGFAVPKPVDTTAQECPDAGCDQSVVTDTLRVKSFPTTARAQGFALDHGLRQVETVVVEFAPPLTRADQDRYWAQIQALVR